MNPLSIFHAAARAGGARDNGYVAPEPPGQDDGADRTAFARMLDPAARGGAEATQAQRSDGAPREPVRERSPRADRDAPGAERDGSAQGSEDKAESARASRAGEETRSESRGGAEAAPAERDPAEAEDNTSDDAGAWPPPGLGGFGMMLLGATPATTATSATATAPLPPGAALPTALPGGDAAATGAGNASTAGVPGLPAPAVAVASTPAPSATGQAADGAQALAALAAAALGAQGQANDAAGGDATAVPGVDSPAFVLPTAPPAPARAHEASAVFSASPTPTPDLQGDGFDEAVATRVAWLADQKIGHAHIKITPNDMGPVEVQLKLDGDKVQASFSSAHADVRQALEQSLPRLREMLGQHGFQLTHSDVGAQQQGQRGGTPADGPREGTGIDALAGEDGAVSVPASVLRARGLLDAYA